MHCQDFSSSSRGSRAFQNNSSSDAQGKTGKTDWQNPGQPSETIANKDEGESETRSTVEGRAGFVCLITRDLQNKDHSDAAYSLETFH